MCLIGIILSKQASNKYQIYKYVGICFKVLKVLNKLKLQLYRVIQKNGTKKITMNIITTARPKFHRYSFPVFEISAFFLKFYKMLLLKSSDGTKRFKPVK